LPKPIQELLRGEKKGVDIRGRPLLTPEASPKDGFDGPVSLWNLLTRDMIAASANYALLALVDMSHRALQPVFFSTPIALGGLGLDPPVIGTIISFFGILNGVITVFFFSRMIDDRLLWFERGVSVGDHRCGPLLLSVPHHQSSGTEFHRALWWAGNGGVGCGRAAGDDVGVGLLVLRYVRSKEAERSMG
jgi:hypothetical protein